MANQKVCTQSTGLDSAATLAAAAGSDAMLQGFKDDARPSGWKCCQILFGQSLPSGLRGKVEVPGRSPGWQQDLQSGGILKEIRRKPQRQVNVTKNNT